VLIVMHSRATPQQVEQVLAVIRTLACFHPAGATETHLHLLGLWLRRYGRLLAVSTDRRSIFETQDKGHALADAVTQFGRALREWGVELICAHRPLGAARDLAAILSIQEERAASNDYTVRFHNCFYQLLPPAHKLSSKSLCL
jgi:hypothetical protein